VELLDTRIANASTLDHKKLVHMVLNMLTSHSQHVLVNFC